jgi:hypothetical protein
MWLVIKLEDGRVSVMREEDVLNISQTPGDSFCSVLTTPESPMASQKVLQLSARHSLNEAVMEMVKMAHPDQAEQKCRVCGCTDNDCRGCVERTGEQCFWVETGLCSACWPEAKAEHELVHVAQSDPPAGTA